jgi:hypothetical protein
MKLGDPLAQRDVVPHICEAAGGTRAVVGGAAAHLTDCPKINLDPILPPAYAGQRPPPARTRSFAIRANL